MNGACILTKDISKFIGMKCLAMLTFAVFTFSSVTGQDDWTLQKEKNGISVSTRKSAKSAFNDVRVQADLPGTTGQLAGILLDVDRYTEWAYATKKASVTKKISPSKLIYYSEIDVPWPATDRFFYALFELKKDERAGTLDLISASLPDQGPVPPDLVRVPFSKGTWHATTLPGRRIHVEYFLELDPGKSLPAWILNAFSTKGPMETFEKIQKKMEALNP